MKTLEEVFSLMETWRDDPYWQIEETPGYEAHHDQLLAFRLECEARWSEAWKESDRRAFQSRSAKSAEAMLPDICGLFLITLLFFAEAVFQCTLI